MLKKPNFAFLTGTSKVEENGYFTDKVQENAYTERSYSQMFFQPYEKKEFIYCARKTFIPLTAALLFYFLPGLTLNLILAAAILTLGLYAISAINRSLGDEANSSVVLNWAEEAASACCQLAVDVLVLPASLTIMLTRGISTGLKEANIYDFGGSPGNDPGCADEAVEGNPTFSL